MAQNQTTEQKLREYRIEQYEEMRFTPKEAARLADSKGDDGFALNYRKVKSALKNGCSHIQAIRIFAD